MGGTNFNAEYDLMVQDREMRDEAKKRKERRERLRRLALKAEEEGRPSVSKEMGKGRVADENVEIARTRSRNMLLQYGCTEVLLWSRVILLRDEESGLPGRFKRTVIRDEEMWHVGDGG